MNTEPAPEQNGLPKCGRLIFRGVELAYLNIDGEYMLPLAELLALVLPTTPRTTLFTRMEKMKVRRHFCQPEEIKLLKTVNGIHGSSANCTLLSKTEVDKYCSMYIDNLSESNNGKCKEDITNESQIASDCEEHSVENCKSNDIESACLNNNKIPPNKLTIPVLHKHKKSPPLKAKHKLTKIANGMKLKSALSADRHLNQTLTDKESSTAIDGHVTSGFINEEGVPPVSSELLCSVHASNFTQTQPLHTNNKRLKKRDKNLNSETNKKGKLSRVKKRPSNELKSKHEFESPLKIPKRSELHGHKEESDEVKLETSQFHFARCSQSSKKQEVESLISDSSSNDSGFASTVLSNASTPTKTDFPAGELSGLLRKDEEAIQKHEHSSPRRPVREPPKLKTPTKNKFKGSEGTSLTLSPPALLLKRREDSWQVEQKSPVKEVANCLHKSKVKAKEKARPGGLAPLFEEACGQAGPHFENKQVKKRRKRRKPLSLKEETSIINDLIVTEKPDNAGVKKKLFIKRKQKGKFTREKRTLSNGKVVGPEKSSDFLTAKVKKSECAPQENPSLNTRLDTDKQSKEDLLKKDAVLDRIVGDAMAKFFGPKSSTVCTQASTSGNTKKTPKPKKAKVAATTKPVLKTNSKFKLLNLFPVTSQLGLQDCGLSPVFTMSCPKGFQPPSSHPLWGWRLGEPIYRESADKFLKPNPVSKPKQTQCNSSTKFVANKVRKLKRRRRRKKVPMSKNPLSASVSNPAVNAAISDSKATENVSNSDSEVKLSLCDVISSIVSSSEILVS